MARGLGGLEMDSINTIQFSGSGSQRLPTDGGDWAQFEINSATIGMSYYIPAMRWDMERTDSQGETRRTIRVVRDEEAWNETRPGIGGTPAEGRAAERRHQIWLTPHGVVRAAVDAETENPGSVTVGSADGRTTLTVSVDGIPITAILDEDNRPERVEMPIDHPVLGETTLSAEYSGYVDWQLLDVYFPSRIVQSLDGAVTTYLTVDDFYQNPYVVFPDALPEDGSSQ